MLDSRPWIISVITERPRDTGCHSYGVLLVICAVDETSPTSCAFRTFRPFAPKKAPSARIVGCGVLLAFAPEAKQYGRD
jgi:hypothetical protein